MMNEQVEGLSQRGENYIILFLARDIEGLAYSYIHMYAQRLGGRRGSHHITSRPRRAIVS